MNFLRDLWDDIKPYSLMLNDLHHEWQARCDEHVMAAEFGECCADPGLIQYMDPKLQRDYRRFLAQYQPSPEVRNAVFMHWVQGKSNYGGEQAVLALRLHGRGIA